MKSHSREILEMNRPRHSARETIEYCLRRLFEDQEHGISDLVVKNLDFEELIGALLQARDLAEADEKREAEELARICQAD